MDHIIEIKNGFFSYSDYPVFEDISLTVGKGEILCLFGPNGCGKTTLLDNLLGHLKLQSGSIIVNGEDIRSLDKAEIARRIAYVPQVHDKSFPFKVIDIVVMGRTPHIGPLSSPSDEDYKKAANAIEAVGIKHLQNRIYTTLSGGETQLVILARALAQDTPLIIMDEPASHLDFRHELILLELITKLVRENKKSVIMSTHSPNHAFYFENAGIPAKIALMHEKKIMASGSPDEIISQENMERIFNIRSRVFKNHLPDKGLSYIIPLKTIKKEEY